jgi:DNA-binding beta-propeller fold protein YncE/sugar lactone lactonase YvrE
MTVTFRPLAVLGLTVGSLWLAAPAAAAVVVVASNAQSTATLFDPLTLAPIAQFATGTGPHEVAVSPDHRFAYVANSGTGPGGIVGHTVTVLDLLRREPKATYDFPDHQPHDLKVSRDAAFLWIASGRSRTVLEVDADDGSVSRAWKTELEGGWMLAATPDDQKIYVPHLEGGGISIIDRRSDAVTTLRTAPGEMGIDVSPDGNEVWFANVQTNVVSVLDVRTDRIVSSFASGGLAPTRVKFTPDGKRVLVPHRENKQLVVFDRARRAPIAHIDLPAAPKIITVSGDGRRAFLTSPTASLAMAVDLRGGKVASTFLTGTTPDGVAWAGDPKPSRSRVAFTIAEPDLVPEGIAHDAATGTFFVGSTYKRKIVAVDRHGTARDFTTEGQDGLLGVVGMKVDVARRRLWVAASDAGVNMPMKGMDARTLGRSSVFLYDVETGKLLRRHWLGGPGEQHFLNDLVVAACGDVYITDSKAGAIYVIREDRDKLELFVEPGQIPGANGIALSEDERSLIVAWARSLAVVDVASRRVTRLETPIIHADGLAMYKGDVVAVQPWEQGRVVARYALSRARDRIEKETIVELDHPELSQPTTGVVIEGELFYIANSQLQLFRALVRSDGTFPASPLRGVVVLRVKLKGI